MLGRTLAGPVAIVNAYATGEAIPLEERKFINYNGCMKALDNVSIVLKDTKHAANIGAAARAMMNMGLSRLVLVDPPEDRLGDARKLAAGAEAVLDGAEVHSTLADALRGQNLVVGTSRHPGKLRRNIRTPHAVAAGLIPLLGHNKISIVFGNEVNGLENDDLKLCSEIVAIPSSDRFPSLNLSHAVMVIAYELFIASRTPAEQTDADLAAHEDLELFYAHLQRTLVTIGFLDAEQPDRMMFSLRQLFGRARPDSRDVKVLRGILNAFEAACRRPNF
jgi:tRNA/rRNA methyltransferase/tRNA (cytidine32/uridine32-2'-O)-methyltransferase